MERRVNLGAPDRQMDGVGGNVVEVPVQRDEAGGVKPNGPIAPPPISEILRMGVQTLTRSIQFLWSGGSHSEQHDSHSKEKDSHAEKEVIQKNVIPMPIPLPQVHPEIPLHVAIAEAEKVMEVFPNIEKDFLIKHVRKNRFFAQEIIQQLTFGAIQAPKRHSPGRIHDISLESLDGEESVDFLADEIPKKKYAYYEEVEQRLLQHLEAGLKNAYMELRNKTLTNRFDFQKWVDRNYMNRTIAPNLYVNRIETVMEYALTAENGFLAVLLLSWFKGKKTLNLVCQLFVSQMKTVRTPIVERRENEIRSFTEMLDFCYNQERGEESGRGFGTPPQAFQNIVDIVRKIFEKPKVTFECGICAEEKPVAKLIKCESLNGEDKGNEHRFCIDCVKGYAEASVSEPNVTPGGEGLRCMQPGCKGFLKHAVVMSCIPKDQKQTRRLLEKRLSMAAIIASGIPSEECQFCSYAQVIEQPAEVNKVFDCRKCKATFCRVCKKLWSIHIGKKCQEVVDEEMTAEETAQVKLEEELSNLSIRYCQHCNIAFHKEAGCNKMTCRCGRKQCYLCNMPINDYDHFCQHPTDPKLPGVCPQNCGKACMLWADPKAQEVEARKKLIDSYKGRISDDKLRLLYQRF